MPSSPDDDAQRAREPKDEAGESGAATANDDEGDGTPDLLHAVPSCRIPFDATRLALSLAFAGGAGGNVFGEALDAAHVAPSSWEPGSFANDLFLATFVGKCLRPRLRRDGRDERKPEVAHLTRLLAAPPRSRDTVDLRRAVLTELVARPALREALERLYLHLTRFRALLEAGTGPGSWDANRRQLDLLSFAKQVVDEAAEGFVGATSALSRLAAFGARVRAGEPYRSLADLLRYDERLATVNLTIGVGADGRVRGFAIASVEENAQNPFVASAWRRWLAKLELFARGFRFGEDEVMARLIDAVFEGVQRELTQLVQLLGDLEFYLGGLAFRDRAMDAELAVCLPELAAAPPAQSREGRGAGGGPAGGATDDDDATARSVRFLDGLFNPLLLAHGAHPVPCGLEAERASTTVLVTGPNSGGKTRLLQSLGLTQVLAQSGLFVPARAAKLVSVPALVVSLIQETTADQAEGRLGMELVRIRDLFERLPPGAMVILDELCSGTNPSEGEEIFELVLRMLARLRPQAFITTHFLAFAARLEREQRGDRAGRGVASHEELRFLQVALDAAQHPTYQFVPGVAHTSLAGQAAARLGVTGEQLLALIEANIARASSPTPRSTPDE